MEDIKKKTLKNTAAEIFYFTMCLAVIVGVIATLFYIVSNANTLIGVIIERIGVEASIIIAASLILSIGIYFRYTANLKKLEGGKGYTSAWLSASDIPVEIPEGKYNIELKSGRILWKATKRELEANRHDVAQWMIKE
ncbi:hypothetical protein IBG34_23415 (plasmid) [Aeromonas media]|uniref:Uncharacterized protein n=1 Tax=Aeromonas caviae TaxID=648 RepID=A0A7D5UKP5_AERCA|nr:hypothetical protein [Aeromonas caviae]QLI60519.1 hypothetical protein C1C91_23405 [Aeromonas caviae]QYK83428.1 hypothetical protein IBG34_23415 [Aeromonas media]